MRIGLAPIQRVTQATQDCSLNIPDKTNQWHCATPYPLASLVNRILLP